MATRACWAAAIRGRWSKAVAFLPVASLLLCAAAASESPQLQALARAYLENPTASEENQLRRFAAAHATEERGLLAYLALGYGAFQNEDFRKAADYLNSARSRPTPVSDYADYHYALAVQGLEDHAGAGKVLTGFETRYPQSTLKDRANLALARSLLAVGDAAGAAALLGARLQSLPRPAADLLLAQVYGAQRDPAAALRTYADIYYRYPASAEAAKAARYKARFPKPQAEQLRARAEGLLAAARGRRAALLDAAQAYRALAASSSGAERERALVGAGAALYRANRTRAAIDALARLEPGDPEVAAQRLYLLAGCYRQMRREQPFVVQVRLLGERHPSSPWYEEALYSAGNFFLLKDGPNAAAPYYQAVYERFPAGKYAVQCHWKVAWIRYREGNYEAAGRLMQDHALKYPSSTQVAAALYWLGRMAEQSDPGAAAAYLRKTAEEYPNYFYGGRARQRLERVPGAPVVKSDAGSARDIPPGPEGRNQEQKIAALKSAGLLDLAAGELRYLAGQDAPHSRYWFLQLARLEHERGRYQAAMEHARRVFPNHLAYDLDRLRREDWELLFPLPWWEEIREKSALAGVDPYLVAGVMRQESAFSPGAVSRARARGLMQVLPSTGRRLARKLGLRRYRTAALFDPALNIRLGTVYLKQVLDRYEGRLEDALASYNAGPHRVDAWRRTHYRDAVEFVESIPFTETRDYVMAVERNTALYRKIYPAGERNP